GGRHRGFRDDPDRRVGNERDRREIIDHVVGQLHHRGVEHVGLYVTDAQRIAVRRGAGDAADADAAAGAADVLGNDGLVQHRAHAVGQNARDGVGRAAGRIGHHDGDDARRERLRPRGVRRQRQDGGAQCGLQKLATPELHCRAYPALMSANWMTLAHLSTSAAMNVRNSAVLSGAGSAPRSVNFGFSAGSFSTALMVPFSFSTSSPGVPLGAAMPCQMSAMYPGTVWAIGGTPGSASVGAAPLTPSARTWPERMKPMISGTGRNDNCTWPLSMSGMKFE